MKCQTRTSSSKVRTAWKEWDSAYRRLQNAPDDISAEEYLRLAKKARGAKRSFLFYSGQNLHVQPTIGETNA